MNLLRRIFAFVIALVPTAAVAQQATPDWLMARAPSDAKLTPAIAVDLGGTEIQIVDPIVFPDGLNSDWTTVPRQTASFQMIMTPPPYVEPGVAMLTFSDRTPVCTRSAGLLGVDAGTGAFMSRETQTSVTAYLPTLAEGWTLYDAIMYDQSNGDRNPLTVFKLPDGAQFAGFSTGGDGGFRVRRLYDANDQLTALVVVIRWDDEYGPLLPPDCTD